MLAMGISQLFGIELMENFRTPYFASNINEFWDRWHISLSKWLAAYIYIPLGGNRKGIIRKYINIGIVFLISGIWHGVGKNFLIWGLLHAAYTVLDDILRRRGFKLFRDGLIGKIITFAEVTLAWIFFRASSASGAIRYIKMMLLNHKNESIALQLNTLGITDILLFIIILIIWIYLDYMLYKRGVEDYLSKMPPYIWVGFIYIMFLLIMVFGVYGPTNVSEMIYMNF